MQLQIFLNIWIYAKITRALPCAAFNAILSRDFQSRGVVVDAKAPSHNSTSMYILVITG